MKIAIIGAGRMGSLVLEKLPAELPKCIIDSDGPKAERLAAAAGAAAAAEISACADADAIVLVLPAEITAGAAAEAASHAKPGALLINLATNGTIPDAVRRAYPAVLFAEAKIIGHAGAMRAGAKGLIVLDAGDRDLLCRVREILGSLGPVELGDASLVPCVNTIGSTEGIRAAVACRKQLAAYRLPRAWADAVIATVCAGTMRAYVDGDLGGFGQALADRLETEDDGR